MIVLEINPLNPEKKRIRAASDLLSLGKIAVYPTDTVYGLGCRIDLVDSVKKIFEIKKRDLSKPLSIACSDIDMAKKDIYKHFHI